MARRLRLFPSMLAGSLGAAVLFFGGLVVVFVQGTAVAQDNRPADEYGDLRTVGYVETVVINPGNMRVDAKIDTGAYTSSIDTLNIVPFRRGAQQWVRFTVSLGEKKRRNFSMPVVRVATIKRASAPPQRRYVVAMDVCLGGIYKKAEITLVNRNTMAYRMLIGRLYMAGDFLVDPNRTYVTRPDCQVQ